MSKIRKQVYLTKHQDALLRYNKEKIGGTISESIRIALDEFFKIEYKTDKEGKFIIPEFLNEFYQND